MKKNKDISTLDPRQFIIIKGARMHNLKNVDVAIPRNKMIVITGLSGSGKSSLAFDTLYAEGQRRYVESLSAYARQFLGKLEKPQVDYIKGISPAIAIEQKVISRNPRSTVGTITEVYDYLKLLFARIGKTYSPISGELVKRHTISDVTDFVNGLTVGSKLLLLAPLEDMKDRSLAKQLDLLSQQGFTRAVIDESIVKIADLNDKSIKKNSKVYLLIDRLVTQPGEEDFLNRVADSVQTTFNEGRGTCEVWDETTEKRKIYLFSNLFERDGILFEEPDGRFPNHHPDPTVEKNLVALKKAIAETKSVAGIGFDGDADRIGLVDEGLIGSVLLAQPDPIFVFRIDIAFAVYPNKFTPFGMRILEIFGLQAQNHVVDQFGHHGFVHLR